MPEQDTPYFFKGHNFDLKEFRRDLYRLLCLFQASEKTALQIAANYLGQVEPTTRTDPLESLQKEFFTDEVSRILLQTSIVVRILDDELEADPEEKAPRHCGTLEQPSGQTPKPLTLREACNKLIHARKINFDIELVSWELANPLLGVSWVQPRTFLYGYHQGIEWKATIEVIKLIEQAYAVLRYRTLAELLEDEGRTK